MNTKIDHRNGIRGLIALVALSAMLVLPAAAFGQTQVGGENCNPTDTQYVDPTDFLECEGIDGGGDDPGAVAGIEASGDPAVEGEGLPLTGLDALTLLAVAAALTGTGLVLRRATSNGTERS